MRMFTSAVLLSLSLSVSANSEGPRMAYRSCVDSQISRQVASPIEIRSLAQAIFGSCMRQADNAFATEQEQPITTGPRAVLSDRPWDEDSERRRIIETDREILWIMGQLLIRRSR